jgi:GT2 family glycosyltransferase
MSIATFSKREPANQPDARELQAALVSDRDIVGHVYDPAAPDSRFVVELLLDGHPARIARAHHYDAALAARGFGDGCYRFAFTLDSEILAGARLAEVRIANTGEPVGAPLMLADAEIQAPDGLQAQARWAGGLRIEGWISFDPSSPGKVRAFVDGNQVAETRARSFTHVGEAVAGGVARGFTLTLPLDFADGRLRRIKVVDENGRELPGSPCPVIAFPRGLEEFLEERADLGAERLRAGLFDRLLAQSFPVTEFAAWARAFPPVPAFTAPTARIAVALIGDDGFEQTLESLKAQSHGAAVIGVLPSADEPMAFATSDLAAFLEADVADADIIIFALTGTRLHPHALGRLAEALARFPETPLAYCDLVLVDPEGRNWPLAFSAFDYERLLEQGYAAFCFAARTEHVRNAVNSGVGDLFRLFNLAYDAAGPADTSPAAHVPGFLATLPPADQTRGSALLARATREHLEARQVSVVVEARGSGLLPAARVRRIEPNGKVSILIPTRNRADLLKPCLESLEKTLASRNHEIFVIDNDSRDPETLEYFDEISRRGVRIAKVSGPFNFARLVNAGASVASGEYLLLLNNDIEAASEGWLTEMLSRLAEPDVGAVGAQLVFPSGGIQHGGVVLGPNFAAAHAFDERYDGDPGYGELLNVAHETSAVTAACLLTRRRIFRGMGGFDATRFPVLFNDVDYCLRLRAAGRRVVFTPLAHLTHRAGSSRGRERPFDGRHRHQRDLDNLRMAWAEVLADDPFYSPMLGLDVAYAGLAWPPRSQAPRTSRIQGRTPPPHGF